MKKTLLVGLDGACWEYVEPLLAVGRMPTLQRLMDTGVWGTMNSTVPAWTPTAWASIVTGKNPGKHGVFDMLWRRPGSYEFSPTNARVREGTPFWKRLNERGLKVGLVNVPFTHPPQPVDGFLVTGFGTPGSVSDFTYPSELSRWIERKVGQYTPVVDPRLLASAAPTEILQAELDHQAQQVRIASTLALRYPIELLAINLMATDHANHKMPRMDQVEAAYSRTDAQLNELLQTFNPDNVMVISDHGSSRLKGEFLLDRWLRDQGYCVQLEKVPAERATALNWLLVKWLQEYSSLSGPAEKVVRRLIRHSLFTLPPRAREWFWRRIERIYPFARDYVFYDSEVDYKRSQVFPGSVYSGLIYLNLVEREIGGIVSEQRHKALVSEIVAKLTAIEEPETGRPLFRQVFTAEEVYRGAEVKHAPDIIIDRDDTDWNIRTRRHELVTERPLERYFLEATTATEFGWHSRNGIFIFSGQDFTIGQSARDVDLVDVAATILHLYDVPVPEDYDGRVATELVAPELRERQPKTQAGDTPSMGEKDAAYGDAEAEAIYRHLKALGYLG